MSDQTYICDKCGAEVGIGQFPLCKGDPSAHGPWRGAEEPMEAIDDEMLTDEPGTIHFSTIGEKVRYMDKHNIVPHKSRDGNDLNRIARGPTGKLLFVDMGKR